MSIATAINDLSSRIQSAYDACETKGATMPASKTTWNLSSTIESIPAGGGDWYGVDLNELASVDENGQLRQTDMTVDAVFSGVKSIEERMFNSSIFDTAFTSNKPFYIQLKSLSFPDLLSAGSQSFAQAFRNQLSLSSISFPKLSSTGTQTFYNSFNNDSTLTSLEFPELIEAATSAYMYCCQGTTGIERMSFPKLSAVADRAF